MGPPRDRCRLAGMIVPVSRTERWVWLVAFIVIGAALGFVASRLDLPPWALAAVYVVIGGGAVGVFVQRRVPLDDEARRCNPVRGSVQTRALLIAGLLIAFPSGVLAFAWSGAWMLVELVGLLLVLAASVVHDREHLDRGQIPHAMWGSGDARRPSWLGGPRVPTP